MARYDGEEGGIAPNERGSFGSFEDSKAIAANPALTSLSLMALKAWGKVVMGGYPIGQGAIGFIVETDSEEELNEILEGLPLSEVAEAKVTPLRSFEELRSFDGEGP